MSDAVLFRAVVAAAAIPIGVAVDGVPQSLRLGAGATIQLDFTLSADLYPADVGDEQGKSIDVLVTNFGASASMPFISILRPGATAAAEPSYFLNSTNLAEGYLSFAPAATEIGGKFSLLLHAGNLSFVSVAVRVGGQYSPENAVSTGKHVVLSNGIPLNDNVGQRSGHFYVFYVPPDVDVDITISVDPRQGDADLYINTNDRGFYSRVATNNEQPATWSSQLPSGQDRVVIR